MNKESNSANGILRAGTGNLASGPAPIGEELSGQKPDVKPAERSRGPEGKLLRAPFAGLLALAASTRAAALAAGLAAAIATAPSATRGLKLAGLAQCHCAEDENEREKCDGTLHGNLL